MERIAVYPGSFDPVTIGHLDIIRRACRLFDRVIVVVADNVSKKTTFSAKERVQMLKESFKDIPGAEADSYAGLIVDYLKSKKARILIRGMRVVSDMDYEFQMASMNRALYPEVETVFLMPDESHTYLSSSIVKDVVRMGADAANFLPAPALNALSTKLKARKR